LLQVVVQVVVHKIPQVAVVVAQVVCVQVQA
jgi:hypothetical protein